MERDLITQADKWLQENGNFSRDLFTSLMTALKGETEKVSTLHKGKQIEILKPSWFDRVVNFRKLHERVQEYRQAGDAPSEEINEDDEADDLKLYKKIQKLTDENNQLKGRIKKSFRKIDKSEQFIVDLIEAIKIIEIPEIKDVENTENKYKKGIIHLSDLHFDMLINEPCNMYNFSIASKRLHKFIQEAKRILLAEGITEIFVVNTGDTITSNRRDSEKYNRSTSRGNALIIAVKLLSCVLLDLANNFKVSYATCCGNESRIELPLEYDIFSMSDNFDIIIYNILKLMLGDKINFIDTDTAEGIINIDKDCNVLITHGNNIPEAPQKKIMQMVGRYVSRNININYVLFGDKHCCLISDLFSRCASLCGGNAYSTKQLGFDSRASQNVYTYECFTKSFNGTKIDVQDVYNYHEGYDIWKEIQEFNII